MAVQPQNSMAVQPQDNVVGQPVDAVSGRREQRVPIGDPSLKRLQSMASDLTRARKEARDMTQVLDTMDRRLAAIEVEAQVLVQIAHRGMVQAVSPRSAPKPAKPKHATPQLAAPSMRALLAQRLEEFRQHR